MNSLFTDVRKNAYMFLLCYIIGGAAYIGLDIINDSGKVGEYYLLSIILVLVILIVTCIGIVLIYYRYLYYREKNRSKVKYSF